MFPFLYSQPSFDCWNPHLCLAHCIIKYLFYMLYAYLILIWTPICRCRASLVAQMVKSLSAVWETQVQSLDWEEGNNTLEKEITTHSSILAWRISWLEEPCVLRSMVLQSRT